MYYKYIHYRMKEFSYEGYTIILGENAEENQHLVLNSDANDYWAHISNHPSAHAVICNPSGSRVDIKIIKRACFLSKPPATNANLYQNCNSTCVAYLISSQLIHRA